MQTKDVFGAWTNDVEGLLQRFVTAQPFEHVVIPGFFKEDVARAIVEEFPDPDYQWHKYDNPIERKYARDDIMNLPAIKHVFETLQGEPAVDLMRQVTDIPDLTTDPYLHGAGLHAYPRGGKLDMHLDYSIHPHTGMERRVNLIVYLNEQWQSDEYGGQLCITNDLNADPRGWAQISPDWNTAIIFQTTDKSYHGIPKPITCPQGEYRKSLAIYYVSPPRANANFSRKKAEFFPMPDQPLTDHMKRLYEIRKSRRLTNDELK